MQIKERLQEDTNLDLLKCFEHITHPFVQTLSYIERNESNKRLSRLNGISSFRIRYQLARTRSTTKYERRVSSYPVSGRRVIRGQLHPACTLAHARATKLTYTSSCCTHSYTLGDFSTATPFPAVTASPPLLPVFLLPPPVW